MELKPGYKQTEVGVIPEDWELAQVQQLVSENRLPSGIYKDKELYGRGTQIIKLGDIFSSDCFDPDSAKRVVLSNEELDSYRVQVGDIFIALASVKLEGVGKVMRVNRLTEPTAYDHNVALIRLQSVVNQQYIFYLFKSHGVRGLVGSQATQVGTTFLKTSTILKFVLPLPTLSEQRAIVAALSDVDELIGALDKLIAKKRDLKQAAMQELLSGKRRLPGFSCEWAVKTMGELADIRSGGTPSTADSLSWNGNIPWCTPTDITSLEGYKYLTATSRKISQHGLISSSAELIPAYSIVMTSRATIGECAINKVPMTTNQGFKNFIPNQTVDVDFLYYLLTTQKQRFINLCAGSTFLEIGKGQLIKFEVSLPCDKTEQTAIATILSDMDAEIVALEERRDKTRALKQGMMQELLTGRVRLL